MKRQLIAAPALLLLAGCQTGAEYHADDQAKPVTVVSPADLSEWHSACDQFGNRLYMVGDGWGSSYPAGIVGQDPTCRGGNR
jgi:hypothetical protein